MKHVVVLVVTLAWNAAATVGIAAEEAFEGQKTCFVREHNSSSFSFFSPSAPLPHSTRGSRQSDTTHCRTIVRVADYLQTAHLGCSILSYPHVPPPISSIPGPRFPPPSLPFCQMSGRAAQKNTAALKYCQDYSLNACCTVGMDVEMWSAFATMTRA